MRSRYPFCATAIAILVAASTALPTPAAAQTTATPASPRTSQPLFTGMTFFGDSITDAGNIPRFTGNFDETPPPFYFQGRFSNGPIWADVLPRTFGLSGSSVRNEAIGGATFGDVTISALLGDNPPIADLGVASQVRNFVAGGGRFGPHDLVHLNGGNNEFGATLLTRPPEEWADALRDTADQAADALQRSMQALQDAGARQFLIQTTLSVRGIPNFADPDVLAVDGAYIDRLNRNIIDVINTTRRDGDIVYVLDTKSLFDDVLANPAKYGLTDITTPCLDEALGTVCSNPTERLWWDGQHPTDRVHGFLAAAAADTLVAPRTLSSQVESSFAGTRAFGDRLASALPSTPPEGVIFWLDAATAESRRPTEPFAIGYRSTETSVSVGAARPLAGGTVGLSLEAFAGDVTLDGSVDGRALGGFDRVGGRLGAFAAYDVGPVVLEVVASTGADGLNKIERVTGLVGQTTTADTLITTMGARVTAAWPLRLGETLTVTPTAGILYEGADVDGYRETGAVGLDQIVEGGSYDRIEYEIGARIGVRWGRVTSETRATYVIADQGAYQFDSALATVPSVVRSLPGFEPSDDYGRLSQVVSVNLTRTTDLQAFSTTALSDDDREDWTVGLRLVHRR